jgi:hypothetical protein
VSSLSLFAPIPRITAAPDYPWAHDPVRRETFIAQTVARRGEGATVDAISTAFAGDADLRDWFARMERLAVGPAAVEATMGVIGRTDVRDVLPLIRVPTLVTRRAGDARVDRRHAEHVRDHVPGARFVELPGTESVLFLDDTEPLIDEIEELVTGTRAARPPERVPGARVARRHRSGRGLRAALRLAWAARAARGTGGVGALRGCRSAGLSDRLDLDLDAPARVEQPRHDHHRGGRPDRLEVGVVGAAHGLPDVRVEQVHPRPDHVAQ